MRFEVDHDQGRGPVVVKRATSAEDRDRLRVEATALAAARHPGVAALVEFVESEGDGESAADCTLRMRWIGPHSLATSGPLEPAAAATVAATLAETVADLHERGLVHTRITPDHVVLRADGTPVLCGLRGATPAQESPPACDVAALGELLTHLLGPADLTSDLEPIPDRRRLFGRRPRWAGYQRRTLLGLIDQATADVATSRPSARSLAAALRATEARANPIRDLARRLGRVRSNPSPEPKAPLASPASSAAGAWRSDVEGLPVKLDALRARLAGSIVQLQGGGGEPGASRFPRRAIAIGAVAVALLVVVAIRITSDPSASARGAETLAATTSVQPATASAAAAPTTVRTSSTLPVSRRPPTSIRSSPPDPPRSTPPGCTPVTEPSADVDRDGCPDAISVVPGGVVVAGVHYDIGGQDDQIVLGDWNCTHDSSPALLRAATGEVFLFDGWATSDHPITVRPLTVVPGATGLRTTDADGNGCVELTVDRADAESVVVPVEAAR